MKKFLLFFLLFILVGSSYPKTFEPRYGTNLIIMKMDLENIPLKTVLDALAKLGNLNLSIDPSVEPISNNNVTFIIEKPMTFFDVLKLISKQYNLVFNEENNALEVSLGKSLAIDVNSFDKESIKDLLNYLKAHTSKGASIVYDNVAKVVTVFDKASNIDKLSIVEKNLIQNILNEQKKREIAKKLSELKATETTTKVFYLKKIKPEKAKALIEKYYKDHGKITTSDDFNALIITDKPDRLKLYQNLLKNFLAKEPSPDTIKSETFYVKYISVAQFEQLIKPYLSEKALTIPLKTNALIVFDYLDNLSAISKKFRLYITKTPIYVDFEAKVVEVNRSFERQLGLGFNFTYQGAKYNLGVSTPAINPSNNPTNSLLTSVLKPNQLSTLGFVLSALESINKARSIYRTNVLTIDEEPATIVQGIEYPFTETLPGQTVPTVVLQNVTSSLNIKPKLLPNGHIFVSINLQNQSLGTIASNGQPTINTNSYTSNLVVSDGDTIVVGGVNIKQESKGEQGIPGLMSVPFVGWVGKTDSDSSNSTEIFIFITPHIIKR